MDIPNLVECGLDGLKERIDGPKENQNTDADEYTALRCVQIALYHLHDRRYEVGLTEERFIQLVLNDICYAEALRDGYNHSQNRYDGEDKRVGECFGFVVQVLARKSPCDQHDRTNDNIA